MPNEIPWSLLPKQACVSVDGLHGLACTSSMKPMLALGEVLGSGKVG